MKDSANLDILRSLAVTMVVVAHLGAHLQWDASAFSYSALGRVGVALFFVHTTFVLLMSLERHGCAFEPFMVRRIFRIYPLSMTIVAIMALLDARWSVVKWPSVLSNLLLVQNLTGHLSTPRTLWSLPYEVQMYLVLPALFAVASGRAGLARVAALWFGAVFAVLVLWRLQIDATLIEYVPCFLPGVLAFALARRVRRRLPAAALVAAAMFAALAIPAAVAWQAPREPLLWVAALALGALIPFTREAAGAGLVRIAKQVVTYSYGIYLTHLLCIGVAFFAFPTLPAIAKWAVFFTALAALSCAAYRWIERPGIAIGVRLADKIRLSERAAAEAGSAARQ
jgi:peptidoglycan/LPS O-acetylase OafA/YrhL